MVLDFLEELAAQPCGKTVPEAFCATLQFMERVAGIALEFRLGKQTAVLRTVEQLSAQLETGAPPSRKARPQPLILILALLATHVLLHGQSLLNFGLLLAATICWVWSRSAFTLAAGGCVAYYSVQKQAGLEKR